LRALPVLEADALMDYDDDVDDDDDDDDEL